MSFREWADKFGYATDSHKAYVVWQEHRIIGAKLIVARIDAKAERERFLNI